MYSAEGRRYGPGWSPEPGHLPSKEEAMVATSRHEPGREGPGTERRRALAGVDRDYPPWHAWPGVLAGVLYARRPGTSPPMVVRSVTIDGLRQEIEHAEHERGL